MALVAWLLTIPQGAELGALLVEAAERGDAHAAGRALGLLPGDAGLLRARALLAQRPPDLGRAREELLAARAAGNRDPEIAGRLGIIAHALGEDAVALEELERHATADSPLPDALLALGRVRSRGGDEALAAAAFELATAAAPWSAEAWQDLAAVVEGSDPAASLAALDRALELQPAHRGARLARMRLSGDARAAVDAAVLETLVAAGEKEDELDARTAAALAGLEPDVSSWRVRLAEAQAGTGEKDAARSTLKALPSKGCPPLERVRAALLALQLGVPETALALTEQLDGEHALGPTLSVRGTAELALGRNGAAVATLRQAAAASPWRHDVRIALARAMLGAGVDEREVVEQLETARALAPRDPRGRSELGALHRSRGERDRALTVLGEATQLEPDSVAAHDQLGLLLHEMGRFDEAVEHLERAASLAPGLRRVRYNLGGVLLAAGRPAAAIPHLEAACDESLPGPAPPANASALLAAARRRAGS
jgi:tetratricopeptide (TPR) repeat protein